MIRSQLSRIPSALLSLVLLGCIAASSQAEDILIYTCRQGMNSRIYVMAMDGTVYDWFQYDYYMFYDLEVVNGEVHVVDAIAPRSYIFDPQTGDLELIIDDWSLYYFYDIAWDGSYLYVTEWSMNRYLPDGSGGTSASFDLNVLGSTFYDGRLWTMNSDSLIRTWDVSNWPLIVQDPLMTFTPPSPACKGLSHDGELFWTAEAIDGQTGYIYSFDSFGNVVDQVPQPAFKGWAACVAPGYQSELRTGTWASIKKASIDD